VKHPLLDLSIFQGRTPEVVSASSTSTLSAFGQESNIFSICRIGEFLLHFLKVVLPARAYYEAKATYSVPQHRHSKSGPSWPPLLNQTGSGNELEEQYCHTLRMEEIEYQRWL
jgi:hypothetical protein